MSTSDIINAISTTIAAASLSLAFLQYRLSKLKTRTETSRRAAQYQRLTELAARAAAQAETAKIMAKNAVRGIIIDAEDLRALSSASAELAEELSTEAEFTQPTARRRNRTFWRGNFA